MKVTFWGTRGSYPQTSPDFKILGADTCSIELSVGEERLIIDGGTGLNHVTPSEGLDTILLSHYHLDHIFGLPVFFTQKKNGRILLMSGMGQSNSDIENALGTVFGGPGFPVSLKTIFPKTSFFHLPINKPFDHGPWNIVAHTLNHPGGATGYRIRHQKSKFDVTYLLDHEHQNSIEKSLIEFAYKSSLLVWDACYDDCEYHKYKGFGHSTWQEGLIFSKQASCTYTSLIGHSFHRTDSQAYTIRKNIKDPNVFLANDRQVFTIR